MNFRRYIWYVIVDLAPIYSVFGLISVGINPLCDYHPFFIHSKGKNNIYVVRIPEIRHILEEM
jgi:hypothetical protein